MVSQLEETPIKNPPRNLKTTTSSNFEFNFNKISILSTWYLLVRSNTSANHKNTWFFPVSFSKFYFILSVKPNFMRMRLCRTPSSINLKPRANNFKAGCKKWIVISTKTCKTQTMTRLAKLMKPRRSSLTKKFKQNFSFNQKLN